MSGNGSKRNNGYIARGQSPVTNRNAGKGSAAKGRRSRKTLGFDLSDAESRIAFYAFIIISVLALALLIAGFALGLSRCGSEDVPEPEAAEQQAEDLIVSYADIEDVRTIIDDAETAVNDPNYSNGSFSLYYDPEVAELSDRFDENGGVTVSVGGSKAAGVTVTRKQGMEGIDPAAYLDSYVDLMGERSSILVGPSTDADRDGAGYSERSFTMYNASGKPIEVRARMAVSGDEALITQLTADMDLSPEEIWALAECYYSVKFNDKQ